MIYLILNLYKESQIGILFIIQLVMKIFEMLLYFLIIKS